MNWPLPLTPIEELFVAEDRPDFPCCCFLRAEFSGRLDRPALEAAILTALRRHPLLTARVVRKGRRLCWLPVDNPRPPIDWRSMPGENKLPPATGIDLSQDIGIRFQVLLDGSASTLVIQRHHAVCDGIGILQFLHDVLIAYAAARGDSRDRSDPSMNDPALLARRGNFGLTTASRLGMVPRQIRNLWEAWRFVRRVPSPMAPLSPGADVISAANSYPTAITARLTREESASLRESARALGVTLNDLLLKETFLAIHEWRQLQSDHRAGDSLRVAVPVNLRTMHDHRLPAANVVSMLFLDRTAADFDDPDALLSGLNAEVLDNRRRQKALTFILATALCRYLPGGLTKQVRANKCHVSTVFSNLGPVFEQSNLRGPDGRLVAAEVTLENLAFLIPCRPYMAAGIAVSTYAGRLGVTLHYDSRTMTPAQASRLMAIFLRRIRSSIDQSSRPHEGTSGGKEQLEQASSHRR